MQDGLHKHVSQNDHAGRGRKSLVLGSPLISLKFALSSVLPPQARRVEICHIVRVCCGVGCTSLGCQTSQSGYCGGRGRHERTDQNDAVLNTKTVLTSEDIGLHLSCAPDLHGAKSLTCQPANLAGGAYDTFVLRPAKTLSSMAVKIGEEWTFRFPPGHMVSDAFACSFRLCSPNYTYIALLATADLVYSGLICRCAHRHQFLVCIATSHKPSWGQIHIFRSRALDGRVAVSTRLPDAGRLFGRNPPPSRTNCSRGTAITGQFRAAVGNASISPRSPNYASPPFNCWISAGRTGKQESFRACLSSGIPTSTIHRKRWCGPACASTQDIQVRT